MGFEAPISWLGILLCCCFADHIGRWLDIVDEPDGGRKVHARPTPLIGGIALMLPLSFVALTGWLREPSIAGITLVLTLAGVGFTILGWLDDRRHVAPWARLLSSTLLCSVLLLMEPGLRLQSLEFDGLTIPLGPMAIPFTLLCLVGLQNAVNMADGLNGLVIGLSGFWTLCLLLYAPPLLTVYLICLLIGLLILLPFNLGGHLFLGDSGSYSLGAVIGLLMIYVRHQAAGALPTGTIVLWLLVPVIDCLRIMALRALSGRSPLSPDCDHLHHRLMDRWSHRGALAIYVAIVAVPGMTAALVPATTIVMLPLTVLAYLTALWQTRPTPAADRPRTRLAIVAGRTQRAE